MKPLFIVLEALDGVGKTTLAKGLAARLGGVAMNTPGEGLRAVSGQILDGLGPNQPARCLFYAGSVIARGEEARALVEGGQTVVMDRYWLSTISYARARGVEAALDQVEALVPAPDVTLLLTLDEEERQRRMQARGFTAADRETLEPGFRDRVLLEMRRGDRRPELLPLDVDLSGGDPAECIERVVRALSR
ncbi:MAG: thymidylate kinase [Myxococcota bacterium]|nr:thymidylate kinase [Myxococcota bacterium]